MIVRHAGRVLHLITQPDHAALAHRIMQRWEPLRQHARRASILLAIQEHDNGWREPDASPPVDPGSGQIYDFINAPATIRQAVWPRGVARLSHDPWAAALVAQHALTIYDRYKSDTDWSGFFTDMSATRSALVESCGLTLPQLSDDYVHLRIGDLISLVFCNGWREPQQVERWRFQLDGERVAITPGSFAGDLEMAVPARELADTFYASDAQLKEALQSAPAITLMGVISPGAAASPGR